METYNYLGLYIFLTFIIISVSIIKKRTKNDSQKIIRLANFFWIIPAKIFAILYGISLFLQGIQKLFFTVLKKSPNKHFPPFVSFFLNYGIFAVLFVYALFGQEIITLFIIFIVITSLISYSLGVSSGYSLFPYEIKKIASSGDGDIWVFLNWLVVILILIAYIILLMLISIPIAYIIAFIYRYNLVEDMPPIPEMPKMSSMLPPIPMMPSMFKKT